jgi:hypothetical protein
MRKTVKRLIIFYVVLKPLKITDLYVKNTGLDLGKKILGII